MITETYTWKTILSPPIEIEDKDVELVVKRINEEMAKMRQELLDEIWGEPEKETTFPERSTYPFYRAVRINTMIT